MTERDHPGRDPRAPDNRAPDNRAPDNRDRDNRGLDPHDRRLLALVQRNNRRSHDALAAELNLSASAVRRRLKRLRDEGVIVGDVSIVEPGRRMVTVITSIRLLQETHAVYEAFKRRMRDSSAVAQCYTVSGEADFIVIAHFDDLKRYEDWIDRYILTDDAVQRSETNIVYSRVKYETAVSV